MNYGEVIIDDTVVRSIETGEVTEVRASLTNLGYAKRGQKKKSNPRHKQFSSAAALKTVASPSVEDYSKDM